MRTREKAVDLGRDRCPFCHDGVARERAVACQDCLARHHDACWDENTRCAACGAQQRLEPQDRPGLTPAIARATLLAAGYAAGEVDACLANPDPARGPRPAPLLSPFRITVDDGRVTLRWDHWPRPWLFRLLMLPLLPFSLLLSTSLWTSRRGVMTLDERRLDVDGLFPGGGLLTYGLPRIRRYDRDRLRAEPAPNGLSLMLSGGDRDEVLHVVGEMGVVAGMPGDVTRWLCDLVQAWRRRELDAWLPHLGLEA